MFLTGQNLNRNESYIFATDIQNNPCKLIFAQPSTHSQKYKSLKEDEVGARHFLKDTPTVILSHIEPPLQECHALCPKKNKHKRTTAC